MYVLVEASRKDFLNLCVVTKILYINLVNFFLFVRANKFWMKGLQLCLNRGSHQGLHTSGFLMLPSLSLNTGEHGASTSSGEGLFLLIGKEVLFFLMSEISAALVRAEHRNCHLAVKCCQQCRSELLLRTSCLHLARAVVMALTKKDASSSDCQVFAGMRSSS